MARAADLNFVSASSSSSDLVSRRCIASMAPRCSMRICRCLAIARQSTLRGVGQILVGCSGWQYADWREAFYPKGCPQRRWLEVYARRFPTVEVNSTFYRLPKRDPVARWVEQVPDDFVFTVKVSRYLTHIKRLTTVAEGWPRLAERIEPMIEAGGPGAPPLGGPPARKTAARARAP